MLKKYVRRFFAAGLAVVIFAAFSLVPIPAVAKAARPSKPSITIVKKWSQGNSYCVKVRYKSKNATSYAVKPGKKSYVCRTPSKVFTVTYIKGPKPRSGAIYVKGMCWRNSKCIYGPEAHVAFIIPKK